MTAQWKRSTATEEDANGIPYIGAQAWIYNAGTTTPRAVYSNSTLAAAITQPFVTDSNGKWPQVFVQPGFYRYVIKDASGTLILDEDNVDPGIATTVSGAVAISAGGTGATTAATALSNLGAASQTSVNDLEGDVADLQAADIALDTRLDAAEASITSINTTLGTVPDVMGGFRQGIHSAPTSSIGTNAVLPATNGALSISTLGITSDTPLVVSCSKGFSVSGAIERFGISTSNLTWSSLVAASTNYLFVDISSAGVLTTGSTTVLPIYRRGGTPSSSTGQFTYQIDRGKGYVGDGIAANESNRVFIGEAVTDGSTVTQAFGYAIGGFAAVSSTSNLPAANASQTISHNVGTTECDVVLTLECVIAEGPYVVGDIAYPVGANASAISMPRVKLARNTTEVSTPNSVAFMLTGAAGARLDPAVGSWRIRPVVRRNF